MVKKIVLLSLILCLALSLTGCFFLSAPERTNPFDPLYSEKNCRASLIAGKISVSWDQDSSDFKAYRIISSVVADDIRLVSKDYLVQSNMISVKTSTNIFIATATNVLLPAALFNTNVPNYFAVIYRTSTSAKGSTIATINP